MNEENSYVNAETPRKKKRSLWWLWFLLLLAAFAGGCVVGLKINTLPLPTEVRDRLYPVLESYIPGSTTPRTPDAVTVTPEPTSAPVVTPEPTAEPEPTPAPEVTAVPEATAAPVETLAPMETSAPEETEAAGSLRLLDDSAFESAGEKKYIGIGAALEAALKHAKVKEEDAEVSGVYRAKDEDGETVYEVSFRSGELAYEYQIDAYTGEIAGWKMSGFNFSDTATFAAAFEGNDMPESSVSPVTESRS